jgi:lipid-binding SYLF domain-containing protein
MKSKASDRKLYIKASIKDNGKGFDFMIPPHILSNAKGLAIFTVLKAGFLFSGRAGSGLVVAR